MIEKAPENCGDLVDRYSLAIVKKDEFSPLIIKSKKGEAILDFSQNLTGWTEFDSSAPTGMAIRLTAGEILQDGCFFCDNYRTAKAEFVYISDGKKRHVRAHFTFFGFRYMKAEVRENDESEWRAWTENDGFSAFRAFHIRSDFEQTGFIKTGNEKVNRLFENALWSQKDNFLDVPTDCPQRDERLGWTGDAQVFCNTALFNMDTVAFFRKWLFDMRAEQKLLSGSVPNIVPRIKIGIIGESGSSPWADAGVIVPWAVFMHSGNKTLLEEFYSGMKSWVDFREKQSTEHLIQSGFHFGDWLALDTSESAKIPCGATDPLFIANAYYFHCAQILAKAAKILRKASDAMKYLDLSAEILSAIRQKYFSADGTCLIHTQTALAISIAFGLSENASEEGERLEKLVQENGGALNTGFVGTAFLCSALARTGRTKTAFNLLLREEYPSWLYAVNLGATTIWERWNSVLPSGKMSAEGMNSLNHYSYGAIASFLYEDVCGIRAATAGFRSAIIAPKIDSRLGFAKCALDTAAGRYESEWKCAGNEVRYSIKIPFGCTAELILENGEKIELTSGDFVFDRTL